MMQGRLSIPVQDELVKLHHNFKLLQAIELLQESRSNFQAAVLNEDWNSVQRYAHLITTKLNKSHLFTCWQYSSNCCSKHNDTNTSNSSGAHKGMTLSPFSWNCSSLKALLLFDTHEMLFKASVLLQHVDEKLTDAAVLATGNIHLLPVVQGCIFVRQTLLEMLEQASTADRHHPFGLRNGDAIANSSATQALSLVATTHSMIASSPPSSSSPHQQLHAPVFEHHSSPCLSVGSSSVVSLEGDDKCF